MSAGRHTQFKYRRLIDIEECKIIFSILLRTEGLKDYVENPDAHSGVKCLPSKKDIAFKYSDLDKVIKGAAELLNKQDLCTREKPARSVFYEMSKCDCCRPRVMNMKKIPSLILKVFSTQADEYGKTVEDKFDKYYSSDLNLDYSLMSDEDFRNFLNVLDVSSKDEYRHIMCKIL